MTVDDKRAFNEAFNRLAKAGVIRDLDTATKAMYFDALSDLPLWAVVKAEMHLRRYPVKFFQGSPTWHEAAEQIMREQRRQDAFKLAGQRLLPVQCTECNDTGMRVVQTEPDERVGPCPCRETNQNYLIARARQIVADNSETTPTIPDNEAHRINDTVRDFKRLSSGE